MNMSTFKIDAAIFLILLISLALLRFVVLTVIFLVRCVLWAVRNKRVRQVPLTAEQRDYLDALLNK